MSNERDQGLAALQRGDFGTAVTMLETACRHDPNDFQAYLYLGGAYHQGRRYADAVQVLTHAVQLQPANPQARYNLAVALEQTDRPAEAVTSLQAALALKPDYAVAQQMLQRLQRPSAPPAPANPTLYGAAAPQPPAGYEAAPLNPAQAPPAPSYGAPPLYGSPQPPAQGAYGQQMPPPGYGYPPPGGPPAYGYPQAAGYGYAPTAQQSYTNYGYEDSFSLGDAFQSFIQILISPKTFFADQAGCEGFLAPMAMLLLYMLLCGIGYLGLMFAIGSRLGVAGMAALFFLPFGLAIGYVLALIVFVIISGLLHLLGFMFGNKAPYSGTFRATVYSGAPYWLLSAIMMLLSPLFLPRTASLPPAEQTHRVVLAQYNPDAGPPPNFGRGGMPSPGAYSGSTYHRTQPFVMSPEAQVLQTIVMVISYAWVASLLVLALHHIQRIPIGGAIGVVLIYVLIVVGIFFGLKQALASMVGS